MLSVNDQRFKEEHFAVSAVHFTTFDYKGFAGFC